jgi:small-conductance mechanosensitive channel
MAAKSLALLALALAVGLGDLVNAQEPGRVPEEAEIVTAPVELDGSVLFRVRGTSSLPATTRARMIMDRLRPVAANPAIPVESLRTAETAGLTHILAGDALIMAVVDADASLEQIRRSELATINMRVLQQAITAYRTARSPGAIRSGVIRALAATLMLAALIVALLWFWRWVDRFLTRRLQARIHTVGIQSFELMRAEQIWSGVKSVIFIARTIVFVSVALAFLGYVLAQFPWTRGLSQNMTGFALAPLDVMGRGLVANIPSVVFLAVLFFVVRVALRLLRLFFDSVGRGVVTLHGFYPEWAEPTYKIVRIGVVAFALIVAYPYIPGSNTAAFQGVSLFLGLVFSLGSSSAISNIIAGYMMTYRRALKVGDRVRIGDVFGDVIEMRLQVTHLRSIKNEEIIIPNSQILAGTVLNYSSLAPAHGLILHTEVGIGYETPWRQVEAMLIAAAERTSGLSTEARPFVLEKQLGDFAVTYELNAYCTNPQAMAKIYAELHRNILDVFNEYGVQIMTPAYEGDPAAPKVVARQDWYAAPASGPGRTPAEAPAATSAPVAVTKTGMAS